MEVVLTLEQNVTGNLKTTRILPLIQHAWRIYCGMFFVETHNLGHLPEVRINQLDSDLAPAAESCSNLICSLLSLYVAIRAKLGDFQAILRE